MYTVKEVSETLKISRQKVYNCLTDYSEKLKEHVIEKKEITYITDDGVEIIKIAVGIIEAPIIQKNDIAISDIGDSIIKGFGEREKKQNDKFQEELQELNKQNEKLLKIVRSLIGKESWIGRLCNRDNKI